MQTKEASLLAHISRFRCNFHLSLRKRLWKLSPSRNVTTGQFPEEVMGKSQRVRFLSQSVSSSKFFYFQTENEKRVFLFILSYLVAERVPMSAH